MDLMGSSFKIDTATAEPAKKPQALSLRRYTIIGICICSLLIVGFGGWAAIAELSGAVIAGGSIVVETNLKKVQHPTGGVIGELSIRDGSQVKAGQVLMRLDETVTKANLAMVTKTLDELDGRRARLEAERDGSNEVHFSQELLDRAAKDPGVKKIITGEKILFDARRSARQAQKSQLRERIAQLSQEIDGLSAQQISKDEQIALIGLELSGVEELYKKDLVPLSRLASLQREAARLKGERGQLVAASAQAKGKIAETELQLIQLDQDLRSEVLKELREIDAREGEYVERKIAAEDQLRRVEIKAPQDGVIHQLAVHTIGGVIGPAEVIALVVPRAETLFIEANIAPQDIDQIKIGQHAVVRMSGLNQRTTPELNGTVERIAADLTHDQRTGASFYTIRVKLPKSEIERVKTAELVPGMPAEVHVQTKSRSALSYFFKPLSDQLARVFKEE